MDGSFNLVPIIDYKPAKDVFNSNVRRSFLTAEVYEGNGNDFVWICRYLPGRRLDKYKFELQPTHVVTPTVHHTISKELLPVAESYGADNFSQIVSGSDDNYVRAHTLNTHFNWASTGYAPFNNNFNAHNAWDTKETAWLHEGTDIVAQHDYSSTLDVTNYHGAAVKSSHDYTQRFQHGRGHTFSISAQPVLTRVHNGFVEHAIGKVAESNVRFDYQPNNPTLSVKVFEGIGANAGKYRVDLHFTAAAPAAAMAYKNGNYYGEEFDQIPVDYYELYRWNGSQKQRITNFRVVIGNSNQYVDNDPTGGHAVMRAKAAAAPTINYLFGQDRVFGDYNFAQWPTQLLENGVTIPESQNAVVSFYTTDPSVKNSTFRVESHYATSGHNELHLNGYAEATPSVTTTGIDGIDADAFDGNAEWYTLQGIRVSEENLTPGVYIRKTANGAEKVYVR